jgi:GMP synthase-like glutamine amidotransferase
MHVLIIKNIETEGPGTIEDYLKEKGAANSVIDLFDCKTEMPDIRQYSHLVIMGGPMAVYEMEGYGFLSYEAAMIRAFVKTGRPVLGICLGAQMIAYSVGADVYKGRTKEVGWYKVAISDEGMRDPAFSALALPDEKSAEVFQWHGDTFDLPAKAVRLAWSDAYPNQAFRYGSNVYALQFHIEVTPAIVREWFKDEKGSEVEAMIGKTEDVYPEYRKRAQKFYDNFFI